MTVVNAGALGCVHCEAQENGACIEGCQRQSVSAALNYIKDSMLKLLT